MLHDITYKVMLHYITLSEKFILFLDIWVHSGFCLGDNEIQKKVQLEFSGLKIRIFVICKIGDIWNTEIIETFRPNWKDLGNWNKSLRKYFYKLIIGSLLFCAIFQKGALARVTMMVKVDVPGIGDGFGQEIARFAKTPKKNVLHKIQTQERSLPKT